MLRCSHGLPYETKCKQCMQEALTLVQTQAQQPPPKATAKQREDFWIQCYRESQRDKK